MKISVYGLGRLGCVKSARVAECFPMVDVDPRADNIADLNSGDPPIFAPSLAEPIWARLLAGALQLKTDLADAVSASDIIWVTCGTPVDDDDCAHVDYVEQ